MKRLNMIFALLLSAGVFIGCDSFLDTENLTKKDTSNFAKSELDAKQMVTGIYTVMNNGLTDPESDPFFVFELAGDDRLGGGSQSNVGAQSCDRIMNWELSAFERFWETRYQGIFRANSAIATMDNVTEWTSEKTKNHLLSEVYFLRGFYYFQLAQVFGEVPLVVTTVAENLPKAAADEIYAQIASDLKMAIELGSEAKWPALEVGHATKWVAEAIMARVWLFYTGFYKKSELPLVEGGSVTKDQVVSWLEDCIQNSGHELVSDFRLMWSYTNSATKKDYAYAQQVEGTWITDDVNPEAMFQICVTNLAESSRFCNKYNQYLGVRKRSNWETNAFPFGRGYGWATVNPYVWEKWGEEEPNDIRRAASIWNLADEGNADYTWGNDQQMEETGFWQKKYQTWGAIVDGTFYYEFSSVPEYGGTGTDLGRGHSPQNIQLIRFADVLLMHSELTQTVDGINRVRARVNLPAIGSYSWEALEKERRHELAFEAIRWTDMRRYGKEYAKAALATQLGGTIRNAAGAEQPMKDQGPGYVARYEATYGFRPFPQSEISLSNGALKQNAGWTGADSKYAGWK